MSEENITLKEQVSIDTSYQSIRAILEKARSTAYRAVNFAMVPAYWDIGMVIVEEEQKGAERAKYGKALIKEVSRRLTRDYGKGFTESNLKYMRQFYLTFPNSHALRAELTRTHYRLLLKVEKEEARNFYMLESVKNNWSTRELERQINSLLFERLALSKDREKVLEFYNYVLKCFVLIDLKVGKLMHQDIGQMDFYVRYFEKEERLVGDNPSIGLILCSDKNETMVRYTLLEDSKQIFASKYKLYLPTEDELKVELEREREVFEVERSLRVI
jgi:hypothetical protein